MYFLKQQTERKGRCSVGFGGGSRGWYIMWLPKGYAPTRDMYCICLVAEPPGEDWGKFGLGKGKRPPLIEAICETIERQMEEDSETSAITYVSKDNDSAHTAESPGDAR